MWRADQHEGEETACTRYNDSMICVRPKGGCGALTVWGDRWLDQSRHKGCTKSDTQA